MTPRYTPDRDRMIHSRTDSHRPDHNPPLLVTDGGSPACGGSTDGPPDEGTTGTRTCGDGSGDTGPEQAPEQASEQDTADTTGSLFAVGIGPGQPSEMTARARETLESVDHIVGYETYVDLLPANIRESADDVYATPMCGEVSRTEEAVDRARDGNAVALIGSGDPNVYALAGLALEILESKGADDVAFTVVSGVPAAQSCGARLGAPLVNDTVSISLSDHLTPMEDIESRLEAVAAEGFTIAIYNPWSRKRTENFQRACEILRAHRADDTPVGVVHGAGREDEVVEIVTLGELPGLGETDLVDMTTTIVVGNDETYVWNGHMITPRGYERKYDY